MPSSCLLIECYLRMQVSIVEVDLCFLAIYIMLYATQWDPIQLCLLPAMLTGLHMRHSESFFSKSKETK
jgi:hypothetical protein